MKKIICILSVVLLVSIFSPLQAVACINCGALLDSITETYNKDKTIVTLTYAGIKYLYHREMSLDKEGNYDVYDTNAVVSEKISFPVYHQCDDSIERYANLFPDMSDFVVNPKPSAAELSEWTTATTIEDAKSLFVSTDNSLLTVGLENVYKAAKGLLNKDIKEIHFDISVKTNDVLNNDVEAILKKNKLKLAISDVLLIEAGISTESFNGVNNFTPTPKLYDPINVSIIDSNYIYSPYEKTPNVVAVRLDGENAGKEKIKVEYSYGMYTFDIAETGIYAIVANGSKKK